MTLVVLALAWLLGFCVAGLWGAPPWLAGAWFLTAVPAAFLARGSGPALLLATAALLAVAGAWHFETWADEELPDLAHSLGAEVVLVGRIDSEPDPGLTTVRYYVRADRVTQGVIPGRIPLHVNAAPGRTISEGTNIGKTCARSAQV